MTFYRYSIIRALETILIFRSKSTATEIANRMQIILIRKQASNRQALFLFLQPKIPLQRNQHSNMSSIRAKSDLDIVSRRNEKNGASFD